ncbi:MAG TPA: carboxypeptidase regulatory-like domain-containing protein, partial [Gemmatimonadota bacterium]|nr:carboxypeptidase regulatory-like domain-containing protein [Gemmatimonadota bacterium]
MRIESIHRPLIAATLLTALLPGPVAAQAPAGSHSISGIVIDAATGEALPGSVVVLAPLPEGLLADGGSSTLVPSGWSTTTTGDGSYVFRGLTSGEYALFVSRLDYKPARVDVELVASRARVSVGLIVDPITMESREVLVRSTTPMGRATADATLRGTDRGSLEKDRQTRFLGSDARIVTAGDVQDAVTLAETDLFRALQRLPGVTTRDDYTAELWARGAPWSHTRIYFDGIPLLNPLHGVGMFSGVNPDAVGAVFFHPGARPARFGEGAAAVVDVSTRPTPADTELR